MLESTTESYALRNNASSRSSRLITQIRAALFRGLFYFVLPVALTALFSRAYLPSPAIIPAGALHEVARALFSSPVVVSALVFLLFSSVLRYWRHYLPGFRYTLPISFTQTRISPKHCRALEDVVFQRCAPSDASFSKLESLIREHNFDKLEELAAEVRAQRANRKPVDRVRLSRTLVYLTLPLLVAGAVRLFLFQSYSVVGSSMVPTFESGDAVAARPIAQNWWNASRSSVWTPKRGDVVIADNPTSQGEDDVVKRVIGVPGDSIRFENGVLEINGWKVPRCDAGLYANVTAEFEPIQGHLVVEFLGDQAYLTLYEVTKPLPSFEGTYAVRSGEVFVLGDNRTSSSDSRAWGNLPQSKIRGRVDWFLVGSNRNGMADFSRFLSRETLRPIAAGIDTTALLRRIKLCREQKPANTWPPLSGPQSLVAQLSQSH